MSKYNKGDIVYTSRFGAIVDKCEVLEYDKEKDTYTLRSLLKDTMICQIKQGQIYDTPSEAIETFITND